MSVKDLGTFCAKEYFCAMFPIPRRQEPQVGGSAVENIEA